MRKETDVQRERDRRGGVSFRINERETERERGV